MALSVSTPADELMFVTTPIYNKFSEIIGTGFFFRLKENLFLVSAWHVFQAQYLDECFDDSGHPTATKSITISYELHTKRLTEPRRMALQFPGDVRKAPDRLDLAAYFLPISTDSPDLLVRTLTPDHVMKQEDLLKRVPPLRTVVLCGYPEEKWDYHNHFPLLRSGTLASYPGLRYRGNPTAVVNIAAYPGDSGSPIFFYHDFDKERKTSLFLGKWLFLGIHHNGVYAKEVTLDDSADDRDSQVPMVLAELIYSDALLEIENWERPSISELETEDICQIVSHAKRQPRSSRYNLSRYFSAHQSGSLLTSGSSDQTSHV
jgi:hypothetical protein